MTDNEYYKQLKENMLEQLKGAYMEGAHQGAITTCAIIYKTMKTFGLEETNFLFDMLKDIAQKHGCKDLAEVAAQLSSEQSVSSDDIPS